MNPELRQQIIATCGDHNYVRISKSHLDPNKSNRCDNETESATKLAMIAHTVAAASFVAFVVVEGDGQTSDVVDEVAKKTRRGGDGKCGQFHQ